MGETSGRGGSASSSGQGWGSTEVAEAWKARAHERRQSMAVVTDRMLEAAGVAEGMRVLDLGTGAAEVALLVGERVGARGSVVAVDASRAMVDAARQAVREAGAGNVTVAEPMDAGRLELGDGSFDAVVGRCVLMFTDVPRALAEVRRVLREGASFGAIVWGALERNPFHRVVIEAARGRLEGGWGEPLPDVLQAFAYDNPGFWRGAFEEAGFAGVTVEAGAGERRFGGAEEAVEAMRTSPIFREPIARVPEGTREAAWREVEAGCRACGGVFPAEYRVVGGGGGRRRDGGVGG
jgi:SAM-dependent methyltransferase